MEKVSADWIALALGLGFVSGWFVCWIQESYYWKARVMELIQSQNPMAEGMETQTQLENQAEVFQKESRLAQEISLQRVQENR
jgi:hypothetical protein